ncbi:uncharacterized protein LOC134528018 [Bacillus rossius redtenbacheri]|uniref:uncharacterized protein LOC134528018 n=1 Tax=Bacillus rossius redtenbacheri TaxID=93214 RepID=UPI002FDDB447
MADVKALQLRLRLAEGRVKRAFDLVKAIASDASKVKLFLATARDLPGVKQAFDTDFIELEAAADMLEDFNSDDHLQRMTQLEEHYYTVMATVDSLNSTDKTAEQVASDDKGLTSRRGKVALPKIALPCFDGIPQNWSNFSNLFETLVSNNSELSAVEKLAYLKSALGGEPLGMIHSLSLSEANFDVAWKLLLNRYDNKRLIVSSHVEALLQAPSASAESARSLRQLVTVISENVSALEALGAPVDKWDMVLLPILSKRLDTKLRVDWEMTLGQEFPTLDGFITFLEKHCNAQEAVTYSHSKAVAQGSKQRSFAPTRNIPFSKVHLSAVQVCCICSATHPLFKCPEFLTYNPHDRYSVVKKNNLCLNCLGGSHRSKNCSLTAACKHCGSKHNSLLHFERVSHQESGSGEDGETARTAETTVSSMSSRVVNPPCANHTILLSTAQVAVFDSNGGSVTVRALLDTASQASFITERLMQKMHLKRERIHLPVQGLSNTPVNVARARTSVIIGPVGNASLQFSVDAFVLPNTVKPPLTNILFNEKPHTTK